MSAWLIILTGAIYAYIAGEFAQYVNGYVEWLDQWEVIPVLTEKVVANRVHGYAGTFDAILEFGDGPLAGKTYLCDWKTSAGVYGEMAMQIAAYANADFYLDEEGNEQSLPVLDGLGGAGGGTDGGNSTASSNSPANTGGGSGGVSVGQSGGSVGAGNGGSGVVIFRYTKAQVD